MQEFLYFESERNVEFLRGIMPLGPAILDSLRPFMKINFKRFFWLYYTFTYNLLRARMRSSSTSPWTLPT